MSENKKHWNSMSIGMLKIFLFLSVASQLCSSIYHSYFFEYLHRGHWILEKFEFPTSYFLSSEHSLSSAWYDPNWIFEILISFIETNFSAKGLISLKILLVLSSLYFSSKLFLKLSKDDFFACALSIFACCGFFVSADLSPVYLSLPIFCILLTEFNSSRNRYALYFLLCYILYNTQSISFIFVVSALFFVNSTSFKSNKKTVIACILPILLPPYFGLNLLTNLKHFISSFSHAVLLQSSPASIYDFRFAFLILSWVLAVVISGKSRNSGENINKNLILFASLLNLLALGFNVALSLALFTNCIVIAYMWKDYDAELKHAVTLLKTRFQKISSIGIIWVLIAISFVGIKPKINYPVSKALLPNRVIDLALHRGLKLPLYHDTFSGSYLMYKLSDRSKDVVLNTFQSVDLKHARVDFLSKTLHPYFIKFFDFLAPKSVICRVSDPLFTLLKRDSNWMHINNEQDQNFSWALFEKK